MPCATEGVVPVKPCVSNNALVVEQVMEQVESICNCCIMYEVIAAHYNVRSNRLGNYVVAEVHTTMYRRLVM